MRIVDLCAGTGAISYVGRKYGEIVFANDISNASKVMYEKNVDKMFHGDIHTIQKLPKHDMLCAGFPCQGFSIAGLKQGFQDKRTSVLWKIFQLIQQHKPNIVLLENVKNLISHHKGASFQVILHTFQELKYYVKYAILDTAKVTCIPHHRERVFLIGFRKKSHWKQFHFPIQIVENSPIASFLEKEVPEKYYYTNTSKIYPKLKEAITHSVYENAIYQYRRYYVRKNKHNVVPTFCSNMGKGGHNVCIIKDNKGIRKLTPRECFNLQGFPNHYNLQGLSDSKLYELAGNAITIPILELLFQEIMKIK